MNNKKIIVALISSSLIALFLYLGFSNNLLNSPSSKRYHFLHFGTTIQITLAPAEKDLTTSVVNGIDTLLEKLHYKWHPWRDGELKTLNKQLNSLQEFETTTEIIEIIKKTQKFYDTSTGYFNPAIGKLVAYWGFHQDDPQKTSVAKSNFDLEQYKSNPPNPNQIIIKIKNGKSFLTNSNPNLQLDLSGIIKADAALKIKNLLEENKINNALINIGGDIYVMGNKAGEDLPWIIAISGTQNQHIKLKVLNHEAIATSGVYARQYQKNNKQYHHIINPKTSESALGFYAVTVIHEDPYLADAAATALLVAGEQDYKVVADKMGVDKFILITPESKVIYSPLVKSREIL